MRNDVRCKNDLHSYDPIKHSECPYCDTTYVVNETAQQTSGRNPKTPTVLVPGANETKDKDLGKTKVIFANKSENDELPPTVGWLVVVEGEGKGRDISIEPGQNRIGRNSDMNIRINFGDEGISRKEHAFLIYDPENNAYYLKHGNSQNLTYLNGAMIMDMKLLKAHDIIKLGETKLLFMPLCSDVFNWKSDQ
jgi:hypothetical protein